MPQLAPVHEPDDTPLQFESPESSTIQGASYDAESLRMVIDFVDKDSATGARMYVYGNIDADLWRDFYQARSKGQFFSTRIRPMYAGRRV